MYKDETGTKAGGEAERWGEEGPKGKGGWTGKGRILTGSKDVE
jgi:hypothetical protein